MGACQERGCAALLTIKAAENATKTTCGAPVHDKSTQYQITSGTLGMISFLFIVQRIVFKVYAKIELGLDDLFAVATLLVGIPGTVVNVVALAPNGLGRDIWTIPFDKIYSFGFYYYLQAIMYFAELGLLKLAFLFLYLRIFPSKIIHRLLWITVIFSVLYLLIYTFTAIFLCKPISYFWTKWDDEHTGSCINIDILSWSNSAISITVDLWILAIPLSQLKGLKMDLRKKIGVGIMFFLGTL